MKNLKLLALAFVIGTASVFATTNSVLDVPVKQVGTQVTDLFKTPEFTVIEDHVVHITFTFSSEGEIVVLKVDSKDKDVLNYVRKHMSNKTIETPGEANRIFILPLRINKY